jgi:hypothetical protein
MRRRTKSKMELWSKCRTKLLRKRKSNLSRSYRLTWSKYRYQVLYKVQELTELGFHYR